LWFRKDAMKTEFNNPQLEQKVKNLPHKPGCYLYKNADGKVIYVGKAIDLRKRVSSYFNKVQNMKTTRLVREIVDLDFFVVTNEAEAFLLEQNLIKKYRPRFNILLNDDSAYPYIIITNEHDPQYKYVRKYDKKALRNYGPLPQGSNARNVLKVLERLYPLRRCKGNLGHPCIYYHIHQCSGACFKDVPWSYYQDQIRHVDSFFNGHINEVKQELFQRMENAANNLQFEEAQRLKELYVSLDYTIAKQDVTIDDDKNHDVAIYAIDQDRIALITLFYRHGQLLYKDSLITSYYGQEPEDLFISYLEQLYAKNALPDQLIIPESIDVFNLSTILKPIATHPISKTEKALYALAEENVKEALIQDKLHSQAVNNHEHDVLVELQNLLGLKAYPQRIEMFDISNIGSEFVTGSTVVWIGGKPSKTDFRKYNIDIPAQDDASRLQNMLYRRFQKALVEKRELPDLIIMDGGIIQVHAAKQILADLGLEQIPVIGLIKNDAHRTEKLLDLEENVIPLDKQTPLYNFLAAIQERVDSYAKSGYRHKQNMSFLTNTLAQVPGLGKKKIQELNKRFETRQDLENATFEELNEIIHNRTTTKNLMDFLAKNKL